MQLAEQFRPRSLADIAGQPAAVSTLERLRPWGGKCFWITGKPGQGKDSITSVISTEIAGGFGPDCFGYVDCEGAEMTLDLADKWIEYSQGKCLYGSGWCFCVQEAHGLRAPVVRRLNAKLERVPNHVVWVFTSLKAAQGRLFDDEGNGAALISRCKEIKLTDQGCAPAFAADCVKKCRAAGMLNGHADDHYVKLAMRVLRDDLNYRTLWHRVESGLFDA